MTEPLRLNHLYRVVDRETFAAAQQSTWLRELFAPSELRTTRRPDWTYTGLYLYGTSTYIELFEEGDQGPVGASGLAFAIEAPGATTAIAEAWRDALTQAEMRVVVRPADIDETAAAAGAPESAPWFHIAHAVPDRRGGLHLWSMEYHADFLATWHGQATAARGISRREVLERYRRLCGGSVDGLLDDVTAVTMALTAGERSFLARHVEAFDARTRDVGGDATYVDGDGITIGVQPASDARRGVQDIVCRLHRPAGRETTRIGRMTVDVDGERAVLKFR